MRKNRLFLTYLLIVFSSLAFGQLSTYEEEEAEADEEYEYYEEYIEEPAEETTSGLAYEPEGFYESNSRSSYLNQDTSFKSNYTDEAYQYYEKPPVKPKDKKEENKDKNEKDDVEPRTPIKHRGSGAGAAGFGVLATVLFYIFLVLAIGLIGFLIYQAVANLKIQNKPKLKRVDPHVEIEEDIEKIEELDPTDLRALINKAKEAGNYTLATRFYFLLYLEQLQNGNAITYHRDKTNADYLAEIQSENTTAQFIKLSYLFEYVWYGKKPLDENSFSSLESIFHQQLNNTK